MGSDIRDSHYQIEAIPKIRITHSHGFWISNTLILNEHMRGRKGNPKAPIHDLSWDEARHFCSDLQRQIQNQLQERLSHFDETWFIDLPTESQWEYATRAGTDTPWFFGAEPDLLGDYAICCGSSGQTPVSEIPACQKKPNPWGLFDTYGLIPEFCRDEYLPYRFWLNHIDPYISDNSEEYKSYITNKGTPLMTKTVRGGHRHGDAKRCNSFHRSMEFSIPNISIGFRVVITKK